MLDSGKAYCVICGGKLAGDWVSFSLNIGLFLKGYGSQLGKAGSKSVGVNEFAHDLCLKNLTHYLDFIKKKKIPFDTVLDFLKEYAPDGLLIKQLDRLMQDKVKEVAENMGQDYDELVKHATQH